MSVSQQTLTRALSLAENIVENKNADRLRLNWFRQPSWKPDFSPYPWQADWSNASFHASEIALVSANQVGKNTTAAACVACHLIGEYPPWYSGRRFNKPVEILCAAQNNKQTRDGMQEDLFGKVTEKHASGHGWIPKKNIDQKSITWKGGSDTQSCIDVARIKHSSGGWSTVYFMSYKQGTDAFQAFKRDVAWLDEEPKQTRDEQGIYSEVQTRLLARNGLLYFTRTPLYGRTQTINHFLKEAEGTWYMIANWQHAPHLDEGAKKKLLAGYPPHERKTRTQGIPMMGAGAVFDFDLDKILVKDHPIPDHYQHIIGIDFGLDHPQATIWMAVDSEGMGNHGKMIVYACHKEAGADAITHSAVIRRHGAWIPVAWPHDGDTREKSDGSVLIDIYREHGVNALPRSARWDEDRGGGQPKEAAVAKIFDRARVGTLEIFESCMPLIDEMRMLHRANGKIVAENDDLFKAMTYAMMDADWATQEFEANHQQAYANEEYEY